MSRRISVIIPIYNVVEYLAETLDSVARQSYADYEIIVVDDGSRNEAAAKIKVLCEASPHTTLLQQKHAGQSEARKYGLQHATGSYIWFLDADDKLVVGAFNHLTSLLEAHPQAVAAYGAKVYIRHDGSAYDDLTYPHNEKAPSGDVLSELLQGELLMTPGNVCMRAQTARAIRYPKNMWQGEDWVMFCRMAMQGDVLFAPDCIVLQYRMHKDSVSSQVFSSPRSLYRMLNIVVTDPEVIERVGTANIKRYRAIHTERIRQHLSAGTDKPRSRWLSSIQNALVKLRRHAGRWQLPEVPAKKDGIRVLHITRRGTWMSGMHVLPSVLAKQNRGKCKSVVGLLNKPTWHYGNEMRRMNIPNFHCPEDFWGIFRMAYFTYRLKPDVAHVWENSLPRAIHGALRLLGCPIVWTPKHDEAPLQGLATTKYLVQTTSRLLPPALDTEYYRHRPAGEMAIRRELQLPKEAYVIGITSTFDKEARHIYFLRAAQIFLQHYPNTTFLICGKNIEQSAYWAQLLKFLNLTGRVRILGERWDVADIYSTLDIATQCRINAPEHALTWQALACGTLTVNCDGLSPPRAATQPYRIQPSDDPELLAEAWKYLLELPEEEQKTLRKQGQELARDIGSEAVVGTALEHLYQQLASSHKATR